MLLAIGMIGTSETMNLGIRLSIPNTFTAENASPTKCLVALNAC